MKEEKDCMEKRCTSIATKEIDGHHVCDYHYSKLNWYNMNEEKEQTEKEAILIQEISECISDSLKDNAFRVMTKRLTSLESELEQLKAENSKMREALEEIIKTNWANGKYFGRSSAQLHLTATAIAEQALKP